ncbi:MAG: hypothetical protein HYU64_03095 [Armatimonadetes bacterium]|nr:hypothetical protein [Armatimonadota bacterium]
METAKKRLRVTTWMLFIAWGVSCWVFFSGQSSLSLILTVFLPVVLVLILSLSASPSENRASPAMTPDQRIVEERNRIAQELHNSTAQSLANALFMLNLYEKEHRPEDLEGVRQTIRDLIREIRIAIHDLRNERPWPFLPSLHDTINRFKEKSGLPVHVDITGETIPIPERERNYLITVVEEALANVQKHARATEVRVNVHVHDDRIELGVVDNGTGFDLPSVDEKIRMNHHFGLRFMREKVEQISGIFQLNSSPEKGTEVRITLPKRAR